MEVNHLHDRLHDLDLALQCGDLDSALRHARDLRALADGICLRLTPLVFGTDAELSEVAHD